jgi:hypothetical protein
MPINDKQKTAILPIDANLKATIDAKLLEGYVIQHLAVITVAGIEKLFIVYSTPENI